MHPNQNSWLKNRFSDLIFTWISVSRAWYWSTVDIQPTSACIVTFVGSSRLNVSINHIAHIRTVMDMHAYFDTVWTCAFCYRYKPFWYVIVFFAEKQGAANNFLLIVMPETGFLFSFFLWMHFQSRPNVLDAFVFRQSYLNGLLDWEKEETPKNFGRPGLRKQNTVFVAICCAFWTTLRTWCRQPATTQSP